ncbi:MAG: four-carbon acid sugar kinase family protein [Planctomycetes bacterium]|nr:four-carbon acid sugar kinase family protein [Planctomycetota bacterium]
MSDQIEKELPEQLLLSFYGDDFTGSTDSMEALAKAGVSVALFIDPPSAEDIKQKFAHLQAIGVAGLSRSLATADMDNELRPIFTKLQSLNAQFMHYKCCSTFDSSPSIGSIGRALDIGMEVSESQCVPVIIGAPILKRYVIFGNLFATVGEQTYRIDRHPTMSQHPVTPMNEADLSLHLGKQTDKIIACSDLRDLDSSIKEQRHSITAAQDAGAEIIIFDTTDDQHLARIAALLCAQQENEMSFIVGSSGVEYALAAHWGEQGMLENPPTFPSPGVAKPLLVISGSASPVTAGQIRWAENNNFTLLRLDAAALIDAEQNSQECQRIIAAAQELLLQEKDVLIYSACGPDDPALEHCRQRCAEWNVLDSDIGKAIGSSQGQILKTLIAGCKLKRVCVAGGDTSGHTARALGIEALGILCPIAPGAPLCTAIAPDSPCDGLQVALKGGQVGTEGYFGMIRQGHV